MAVITQLAQTALNFILTIRITDILDIAIVAYLIYRLMMLIRRTSSGQVAKGILVLLVLLWTSSFLHLSVINFILGKTVELGLIALIILFQPELRRVLEQMGSSNRLSAVFGGTGAGGDRMEQAIAQTVAAAADFSKNRIGSLIVFERDMLLEEVIKTGTVLDAEPSRELLGNIFFPKAPLHDGAVVIREGRIISAGCVLPLSTNVNISRELGTRHRAAIGVTEA
ncbi:MAG TPA: diadenylate cyclase CdaA, partial [Oscillospiraceae bacterium]|nr:diadenylate cyclase CdaA [Oscillospiraceae bacterium]